MQQQSNSRDSVKASPPQRGRPAFANSQRDEILALLRQAGSSGVNRDFLIFTKHYTQCGARIFELQKMGYAIRSEVREGRRFVSYILESEPSEPKESPCYQPKASRDWYQDATGKPRQKSIDDPGPLFEQKAYR